MKQNLLFNQASAICKRLAMVLTMLLIVGIGQAWGAEVFNITSYTSFPTDWTNNNVSTGSYFNFNTNGCSLTTSTYDPHTDLTLTYKVATYGSGTNHPLTIQLLDENGNVKQTHTTATPTSITYISGTWSIGTVNYKFKIKFYLAAAGKGVRLQVPKLVGNPATSTEPYTVKFYKTSTTFESVTEKSAGAGVTPPSMELECGDWTFQGWSKLPSNSETSTTELELVTLTNGIYYPTQDVNLYPVYTKTTNTGGTTFDKYTKVDLGGTITSGKYLISTGSYTMAGSGKTGASFSPGSTEKTAYEYTITIDGSYFTIKGPDGNYVGGNDGTSLAFGTTVTNDSYRWKYVTSGIQNKSYTTRHIKAYNTTDFRHYATSNGTLTYLYKRTEKSSGSTYYYSYPECTTETAVYLIPFLGYCKYEHVRSGIVVVSLLERYPSLSHQIDFHHINMSKITLAAKPLL